jgi:hypothetical protein
MLKHPRTLLFEVTRVAQKDIIGARNINVLECEN